MTVLDCNVVLSLVIMVSNAQKLGLLGRSLRIKAYPRDLSSLIIVNDYIVNMLLSLQIWNN